MSNYDALVVVDVQPFYENGFEHLTPQYIEKLESTDKPIIYFYVGPELSNEDKGDVIMFLLKNGLSEDKCDTIRFVEKDYGFYRSFMDSNVSSNGIVEIIKEMREVGITDLRDILDEGYENILEWQPDLKNKLSKTDLINAEVLLSGGDSIYLPHFSNKLFKSFTADSKFEIIGGGRWECLEEIAIHLNSLNLNVEVNEKLSFGAEPIDNKKKNGKKVR